MRTVLEGNAFYEIDEECEKQRAGQRKEKGPDTQNTEKGGRSASHTVRCGRAERE